MLLVALRAVGVPSADVSLAEAFAAWALIRIITTIPITPGGLGVVELGLTGALVSFGGHGAGVVAAVLLYRVLTYVPPIALGGVCLLVWRRLGARDPGAGAELGKRMKGLEPSTFAMARRRSSQLSYIRRSPSIAEARMARSGRPAPAGAPTEVPHARNR